MPQSTPELYARDSAGKPTDRAIWAMLLDDPDLAPSPRDVARELEYDESQHPRDDRGRWTDKDIQAISDRLKADKGLQDSLTEAAKRYQDEQDNQRTAPRKSASVRQRLESISQVPPDAIDEALRDSAATDLANPPFVMGLPRGFDPAKTAEYLRQHGAQEWEAAPRPPDVEKGPDGECYRNASLLVMQDSNLDFVEGYATTPDTGSIVFLHAWAVDRRTGKVVDPTWRNPEKCRYYGVRYDRDTYLSNLYKSRFYGVLGSNSRKVIARVNATESMRGRTHAIARTPAPTLVAPGTAVKIVKGVPA